MKVIDYLYPCFKNNWPDANNIWIYSDPHFGDVASQSFRNDGVTDEEQIRRINAVAGKNDILIILGDVGDISYIPKLHAGYKVLVKGNHDRGKSYYQRQVQPVEKFENAELSLEEREQLHNAIYPLDINTIHSIINKHTTINVTDNYLFDEVYDGILFISKNIVLSHEPVYSEYAFNIHGHDHGNRGLDGMRTKVSIDPSEYEGRHLNTCAEHINYTPVNLKKIIMSGVLSKIPDIHKSCILYREILKEVEARG